MLCFGSILDRCFLPGTKKGQPQRWAQPHGVLLDVLSQSPPAPARLALVTGAGDKTTRTICKCTCSFVVSLSLCLSSAQNYCCFQISNLVHFYFKMTLQVFICDIHFNSTLILHNSHMIQRVCFMRQTWHMKIKNRFFVWNTERNRRGKKKKQWEHTSKDQGGGKKGRKKQDETSESFHPAQSENSSHQ